jgi:hypothetical protein
MHETVSHAISSNGGETEAPAAPIAVARSRQRQNASASVRALVSVNDRIGAVCHVEKVASARPLAHIGMPHDGVLQR